ncbi:MAG: hypothetical protein ABSG68_03560, partial [Thermoguttaceae bacterium]
MKRAWIVFGVCVGLVGAAWADEPRRDVWQIDASGAAVCDLSPSRPASCALEMHGQRVMIHVELPTPLDADWKMDLGWPILRAPSDLRGGIVAVSRKDLPPIVVNGAALGKAKRKGYRYDGVLTVHDEAENGIRVSCAVFPSVTVRAAMEQWTLENTGSLPVTVRIDSSRQILAKPVDALDRPSLLERRVDGVAGKRVAPGERTTWTVVYTLRQSSAAAVTPDVAREKAARQALFLKAQRSMALRTPDPMLDGTFAWAKMRLLEAPVESIKGLVQGTGTRSYLGGVWANDNVEYAAPACPYLADATLNLACNNMFDLWRSDPAASISPSYESYRLHKVGSDRGDQAMMMYGLSNYLLALGDADTAAKFWPLLAKAAGLTKAATDARGIVASRTDELEGRYPTGKANLSTSSLAYGGYRAAARLALALGKTAEADDYQARAAALSQAIESYFGAEVEGYKTYRYFDGCDVLRGWISLPVAMGILQRKEATVAALFSAKLWCEDPLRPDAGTKVVSSDKGGAWPRETYYALRAAFQAGATPLALQKTRAAVRSAMLGPAGPYMDEDGGDLLSPNVLYVLVIADGLFGIQPRGFDRFSCTPRLPADWPAMSLLNVCLMGRNVDLTVERTGRKLALTASRSGKMISRQEGEDGITFDVALPNLERGAGGESAHESQDAITVGDPAQSAALPAA